MTNDDTLRPLEIVTHRATFGAGDAGRECASSDPVGRCAQARHRQSEPRRASVLDYTVPTIPQWRLRGLPLYIGASDVERLIAVTVASITANAALGRFPWSSAVALQDLQGMKLWTLRPRRRAQPPAQPHSGVFGKAIQCLMIILSSPTRISLTRSCMMRWRSDTSRALPTIAAV
jgi:hypothetical protein